MTEPVSDARPWRDEWFESVRPRALQAWRAVEAQHIVATMRLVDSLDEQAVLEKLLEGNKPAVPPTARQKHFLLTTPFRYRPLHGSRFRRPGATGVWYGAQHIRTACAEVAYWRWRFVMDSEGLQGTELLTEHTLFCAQITGTAIDLQAEPWTAAAPRWTAPDDYSATQALADAARQRAVQWIAYASVRDPGGTCAVVFDPQALDGLDLSTQQTWHCRTTRAGSRMVHESDRFEWRYEAGSWSSRDRPRVGFEGSPSE